MPLDPVLWDPFEELLGRGKPRSEPSGVVSSYPGSTAIQDSLCPAHSLSTIPSHPPTQIPPILDPLYP